jgi:competence protein ComEC
VAFFLGGIVLSTVVASLAVAPLGAFHFHRSQQYALLTNLVAVPICNLIVMPAALLTLILMPLRLEALPLAVMAKGIDIMSSMAHWVAGLPGAVIHIPEMSMLGFTLMIGGGLWLTLWQTRWRMLGLIAIGGGALTAGWQERPDLLAGRAGELVAVRADDGRLAAIGPRAGNFDLTRWLEHDGDARRARDVLKTRVFRCDGVGCTAEIHGLRVAVARHSAAIAEDCKKSQIVITEHRPPADCARPKIVIDRTRLLREGTHALYLTKDEGDADARIARIETVASRRGERPWSAERDRRQDRR